MDNLEASFTITFVDAKGASNISLLGFKLFKSSEALRYVDG